MIIFKGRHYVYELLDRATREVLYVGETEHPTGRLNKHVSKAGKFSGRRKEIEMNLVSHYATRKEAIIAERDHKETLKMRTEFDHWSEQGKKRRQLSEETVRQMRHLYSTGLYTQQQIGEMFDTTNVSRILTNKAYDI